MPDDIDRSVEDQEAELERRIAAARMGGNLQGNAICPLCESRNNQPMKYCCSDCQEELNFPPLDR